MLTIYLRCSSNFIAGAMYQMISQIEGISNIEYSEKDSKLWFSIDQRVDSNSFSQIYERRQFLHNLRLSHILNIDIEQDSYD